MKLDWRSTLGIALSVLLLVWTLRDVSLNEVYTHLMASNLPLFIVSAVTATLIYPLRARRWRIILSPVAPELPFGMLWRATAVGMMVNNVVPARAGEIARAFALTRETGRVSFSAAFASLAVDRLFDAFIVLFLMLVAMLSPAFPGERLVAGQPVINWVAGGALVVAAFLVVLYLIVFFPDRIVALYERFARRVAPQLEARGRDALHAFAGGLGVLRSPGRFVAVLGWTLAHWLVYALALWIGFQAAGIDAPFSAALVLMGIIAIGVAVPSSPGFFGVFEALSKAGLAIYGINAVDAVSWAIGFHILSFIPITLIGGYYFARLGLHFRELREAPERAA